MKRLIFLVVTVLIIALTGCQSTFDESQIQSSSTLIPNAKNVITGKFKNGITYVIRKKSNIKKQAELRLLVKVGSLQEDDNQRGFAHFVEHMAFNGTQDFPKHKLIDYLQSIGMKFGRDLNASTYSDRTIYKLSIPTNKPKAFENGFKILENWAHKISFNPQEIENERPVILEEWRRQDSALFRMKKHHEKMLFKGSRYIIRKPIGLPEIIKHGKQKDLIRFYKDWYQPQNMVILAVGDFNPAQVKKLMHKYMASIPSINNGKKVKQYPILDNQKLQVSIATDPEATSTTVNIKISEPRKPITTYPQERQKMKEQLYIKMLSNRLKHAIRTGESPAIKVKSILVDNKKQHSLLISVMVKSGQSRRALNFILSTAYQLNEYGFSDSELQHMKSVHHKMLINWQKGITTAKKAIQNYLNCIELSEPLTDHQSKAKFWAKNLATLSIHDINTVGLYWFNQNSNRMVMISAPDSEKETLPNKREVVALWQQKQQQKYQPYKLKSVPSQLMQTKPKRGKIVNRVKNEKYKAYIWTLSNGATVILKKMNKGNNQIRFKAINKHGLNLLDKNDYLAVGASAPYLDYMGISNFSADTLKRFLANKEMSLKTSFTRTNTKLTGKTSVQDLTSFMQFIHLKFSAPRKDKDDFARRIELDYSAMVKNFNNPKVEFFEAINQAYNEDNLRYIAKYNPQSVHQQKLEKSYQYYRQALSNASDFTFVFVGDLPSRRHMKDLVKTYIASLPGNSNIKEIRKPHLVKMPQKHFDIHLKKGKENRASVLMSSFGQATWSEENNLVFQAVKYSMQLLLRKKIREELGGTYNLTIKGAFVKEPQKEYALNIYFECKPERINELTNAVRQEINHIKRDGIPFEMIKNFKSQKKRTQKRYLQSPLFWLNNLDKITNPPVYALDYKLYQKLVRQITLEKVNKAVKQYFNMSNGIFATLLPENSKIEVTIPDQK